MVEVALLIVGLLVGKEVAQRWYLDKLTQYHRELHKQMDEVMDILDRSTKSNEQIMEQSMVLKQFLLALNDVKQSIGADDVRVND